MLQTSLSTACGLFLLVAATVPGATHAQSTPSGDVLASAVEAPPQTAAPPPEYNRWMQEGLNAFHAGRWAEARALFLRGHNELPNARSFRVLGMTAFNLEQYANAVRELSAALEETRRPLSEELRAQTQALLSRADIFVGRYRLNLDPDTTVLWVDGTMARYEKDGSLLLSVGNHTLEAEAESYRGLTRPILVDGTDGETLRFHLSPLPAPTKPPPQPAPKPIDSSNHMFSDYAFTWSATAGALGFAGAATGLYVRAWRENEDLQDHCADGCQPWNDVTTRRDRALRASQGMLAGALICAVGAVVAYAIEHRRAGR